MFGGSVIKMGSDKDVGEEELLGQGVVERTGAISAVCY
jgi:hypothetical protein